jgi:hypothetical protein
MKVKNEYVQIKIGNKIWTHKNMILNEYLERLFKSQTETIYEPCYVTKCYIKLDEPLENVDYDSKIYASDFDISISGATPTETWLKTRITTNKNYIKINYIFDTSGNYRIKGDNLNHRASILNKYANRKIAAIGFGSFNEEEPLLAYLDTSNMNIIINYNENFTISRLDTLKSDGYCVGYDFPLHFANDLLRNNHEMTFTKAKLYSVGFGSSLGNMEEEYLINDVQTSIDDNSITLNVNRQEKKGVYLGNNLNLGFTPIKDNSQYLIFKYRLYVVDASDNLSSTNKYYTMNMKNSDFGNLDIKLKIERL